VRRCIFAIAALGALAWPGAAGAVLQERTVVTDNAKAIPGATVSRTLNRPDNPRAKKQKTFQTGRRPVQAGPRSVGGAAPGDEAVRALIGIGVGVAVDRAVNRGAGGSRMDNKRPHPPRPTGSASPTVRNRP